jgi:hypothetical protein
MKSAGEAVVRVLAYLVVALRSDKTTPLAAGETILALVRCRSRLLTARCQQLSSE